MFLRGSNIVAVRLNSLLCLDFKTVHVFVSELIYLNCELLIITVIKKLYPYYYYMVSFVNSEGNTWMDPNFMEWTYLLVQ
jgi:hypothetical protein